MIKLIFCMRRLPSLSPDAFRDYWLNDHAALIRDRASVLRIARYVQSYSSESLLESAMQASRGTQLPYDGFAELYWTGQADLHFAMSDPDAVVAGAEIRESEEKFIDYENSCLNFVDEHQLLTDNLSAS